MGLFSVGAFNFSFILLRAGEVGVPETLIPLAYAVINVAHTAIAIPAGLLSDKIGREKVLVIGYGAFLASILLLLLSPENLPFAFLIALVYGVYVGIVETVQRALVPTYAPSDLRGTAYGIYYLVVGSAFLVANTVAGALWEYVGLAMVVSYSALTSATAIMGMVIFLRQGKHSHI